MTFASVKRQFFPNSGYATQKKVFIKRCCLFIYWTSKLQTAQQLPVKIISESGPYTELYVLTQTFRPPLP